MKSRNLTFTSVGVFTDRSVLNYSLPGVSPLPMGFAVVLSNGPHPEIVLADRFPGSFLIHFLDKQKVEKKLLYANAFGQAKSSKELG